RAASVVPLLRVAGARYGHRHDGLLFGVAEHLVETGVEIEEFGRVVEALHHRFERVLFGEEGVLVGPDEHAWFGGSGGVAHGILVKVSRVKNGGAPRAAHPAPARSPRRCAPTGRSGSPPAARARRPATGDAVSQHPSP